MTIGLPIFFIEVGKPIVQDILRPTYIGDPLQAELANSLTKVVTSIIETMTSLSCKAEKVDSKVGSLKYGVISGKIALQGKDVAGDMLLSFDQESILEIVSKMFGEPFVTINQDVSDAVGELTNIICGGVKRELANLGYTIEMASPVVESGEILGPSKFANKQVLSIAFKTPSGQFVLETDLVLKS